MKHVGKLAMMVGLGMFSVMQTMQAEAASPVKFVMDWAFDGPQAIWTAAAQQGCFSKQGLDLKLDRGFGSNDAIGKVASGSYDIGVADFSSVVAYNAAHPGDTLKVVFVVSDRSPTSVSVLKTSNITKPKDLEGKRLADSQGEASRVLFPAFAKANGIDQAKITWISVAPNLRQASLLQGKADGAAGHMFTVLSGMKALGVEQDKIFTMEYAHYGVDVPGSSVIVKPQWASTHKQALQSFLQCAAVGIRSSITDPKATLASLHQYNSLLDDASEAEALDFSTRYAILTPRVKKDGLSHVDPARYAQVLGLISTALAVPRPALGDIWDGSYLPTPADLNVPVQ
jgi:NitT/TauT family transport system substrate-binding protein